MNDILGLEQKVIRLKSISIKEFRGLRDFELDLKGKNFVVCGANGTGKSSITDAIEFCLTGRVSRLYEAGIGKQASLLLGHLGTAGSKKVTRVSLTVQNPSSKKEFVISRSLESIRHPDIQPETPEALEIIEELQTHPEFLLTRKEMTKFINSRSRNRSKGIRHLLRLDHFSENREVLMKSRTSASLRYKEGLNENKRIELRLKSLLNLKEITNSSLLTKVNLLRADVGMSSLSEITEQSKFIERMDIIDHHPEQKSSKFLMTLLKSGIDDLLTEFENGLPEAIRIRKECVAKSLNDLKRFGTDFDRASLISMGLDLISGEECPLCQQHWKMGELKEFLVDRLPSPEERKLLAGIDNSINEIIEFISQRIDKCRVVKEYEKPSGFDEIAGLDDYISKLVLTRRKLYKYQVNRHEARILEETLNENWLSPPSNVPNALKSAVQTLKIGEEKNIAYDAHALLIIAEDNYLRLNEIRRRLEILKGEFENSKSLVELYDESTSEILNQIYKEVSNDLSKFYSSLNPDEQGFGAEITENLGSRTEFVVDFYKNGKHPPNHYHSEGHQDIMGLCLYLALAKYTFKGRFTFSILDDVLMSVDAEHRRNVCRLLMSEFRDTQFIVTTHDKVWVDHLRAVNFVTDNYLLLGSWNIETGPREWKQLDVWKVIKEHLSEDRLPEAAHTLRRYMEFVMGVLAENLSASIKYDKYRNPSLGDLLIPSLTTWIKHLERGIKFARSNLVATDEHYLTEKMSRAKELKTLYINQNSVINKLVHYNENFHFVRADIEYCIEVCRNLLEHLQCEECGSYPQLISKHTFGGTMKKLLCHCGYISINLELPKNTIQAV